MPRHPRRAAARRSARDAVRGAARARPTRGVSWQWPARHGIDEEIDSHPKRRLVQRDGILVRLGIFPAVPEIARIRVVHGQTIAEKDAEAARGLSIVLVDLRQA